MSHDPKIEGTYIVCIYCITSMHDAYCIYIYIYMCDFYLNILYVTVCVLCIYICMYIYIYYIIVFVNIMCILYHINCMCILNGHVFYFCAQLFGDKSSDPSDPLGAPWAQGPRQLPLLIELWPVQRTPSGCRSTEYHGVPYVPWGTNSLNRPVSWSNTNTSEVPCGTVTWPFHAIDVIKCFKDIFGWLHV